jgi:hypothetical protein
MDMRSDMRDDTFDDEDEAASGQQPTQGGDTPYGTREPQPYLPRETQPFPQNQYQQPAPRQNQPTGQDAGDVDRLPPFITGGQPQNASGQPQHQNNGHDGGQADRFPLHRRRRRHRGPRPDYQGPRHGDDIPHQD